MTVTPSIDQDATPTEDFAIRYANALTGLAAGDAWGYQVEFTSYAQMPAYPVAPPAGTWTVSDDTQMTLAVHHALNDVTDFADIEAVTDAITRQFFLWQVDPDNTRAPGRTCMKSLRNLRAGARWYDRDGAVESAGCGAVMRLVPTAFPPRALLAGAHGPAGRDHPQAPSGRRPGASARRCHPPRPGPARTVPRACPHDGCADLQRHQHLDRGPLPTGRPRPDRGGRVIVPGRWLE